MTEKIMSIRDFLAKYDAGKFNNADSGTMIDAGWHDWFCDESELKLRLDGLVAYLRQILPSPKIEPDRHYVWFRNNCPARGELYDGFSVSDIATRDCLWSVFPEDGHDKTLGRSEVWDVRALSAGKTNDPVVTGDWDDVVRFFKE